MTKDSTIINVKTALLEEGWFYDVSIKVENGLITEISTDNDWLAFGDCNIAIPAMHNLHSHSFQRAMAGLTETWSGEGDDFWSWRNLMYDFVGKITPQDIEAISAQLYVELLKEGYASVGEFHYLHHDIDGKHFEDILATSRAIFSGAEWAGIAVCHLPVLYQSGGFSEEELTQPQLRFYNDNQSFMNLFEACLLETKEDFNINLGVAFHSLRAVGEESIKETLEAIQLKLPNFPIHIHIAEQTQEVLACLGHYGKRPINWLLDNFDVNGNWCLIHATHITDEEILKISRADAIVGICPTTEANLGDGIFPTDKYLKAMGIFGIGSDSHIGRDPREELRMLEYNERLSHQRRGMLGSNLNENVGQNLWKKASQGGAQALGFNSGKIKVGMRADILLLDGNSPQLLAKKDAEILNSFVFLSGPTPIRDVYVGGEKVISNQKHKNEVDILKNYKASIERLMD